MSENRKSEMYWEAAHRALQASFIQKWNDQLRSAPNLLRHSPTIGFALEARFYWLDAYCPGCRQVKQVDLRTLDRHRAARIETLIPMLSCRSCKPDAPFVQLLGLSDKQWQTPDRSAALPR